MSAGGDYEKTTEPRPLNEFQVGLQEFLDAASRSQAVAVTVPYGTVYLRQAVGGTQGRDYDVLVTNEHGAYVDRRDMDRPEVRSLVEGSEYHQTKVVKGPWREIWPMRLVSGGGRG